MTDHDQRFKRLLREFFEDFLRLFFSTWAARFDFSSVEWLDKEVFPNPPEGPRHVVDLVAKVRCKDRIEPTPCPDQEELLAAIWIEIESKDSLTRLRPRLPEYYLLLRSTYGIPVLPIGVFLKVGLDGIGVDVVEERFGELTPLRFEYLYVGLPALDGVEYIESGNELGVALASLMKLPKERITKLGAEAFRKLAEAKVTEEQRFLLAECFQQYALGEESVRRAFLRLIENPGYERAEAMAKSMFEEIEEKGLARGKLEGLREANRQLLADRFGPLPLPVSERIEAMSEAELKSLLTRIGSAPSLAALGLE